MQIAYRVAERFSATAFGNAWPNYMESIGLPQLVEVVGLDHSLNPWIAPEPGTTQWRYSDEDIRHVVFAEELSAVFDDERYLVDRMRAVFDPLQHQVLAAVREATEPEIASARLPDFVFKGCELIDDTETSSLTNCRGGFPLAFLPADLNECGLVSSPARAYEIRDALKRHYYPVEGHANCTVWAIWRREEG